MYGKIIQVSFLYCMTVSGLELKKKAIFLLCFHSTMPKDVFFISYIFCHNTIFKHKMLVIRSQDFWSSSSHDNLHSWGCSTGSVAAWLDVHCMWLDEILMCMVKLLMTSLKTTFSRSCNKLAASCNSGN